MEILDLKTIEIKKVKCYGCVGIFDLNISVNQNTKHCVALYLPQGANKNQKHVT